MLSNWDDLRCFLAVAEAGSLTGAARLLDSSQPTLSRRMKALEKSLDATLVRRSADGLSLTPLGELVAALARDMQRLTHDVERHASGQVPSESGRVRIATTECIASSWLIRQLPEVARRFPAIEFEIVTGIGMADLMRRDADFALRVGVAGPDELESHHAGVVQFGLYASSEYLASRPAPVSLDDLSEHVGFESLRELSGLPRVLKFRELISPDVPYAFDSILTQLAAMRSGLGIVPLPKYLCRGIDGIERVLESEFALRRDLWLLTHPDLLQAPRFGVIWRLLKECLDRDSGWFA